MLNNSYVFVLLYLNYLQSSSPLAFPILIYVHMTTGTTLLWSNSLDTSPWAIKLSWPASLLQEASCHPTPPATWQDGEDCRVSTWRFAKLKQNLSILPSPLELTGKRWVSGAQAPLDTKPIRPHFTHTPIFPCIYFACNWVSNALEGPIFGFQKLF